MRQKLFIFAALFLLLLALVGLNALSYVQKEKTPDTEERPNRSTYNTGATGTRALYDLLAETGVRIRRWQEPFPNVTGPADTEFSTYVVIGPVRRAFTDEELERLLNWVEEGGRLVVIDRAPPEELLATTASWRITRIRSADIPFQIDPADTNQMTAGVGAVKPAQPTVLTREVNAVQPSRFAASVLIERVAGPESLEDAAEDEDALDPSAVPPVVTETPVDNPGGGGTGDPEIDEMFQTPEPTPVEPVISPTPHLDPEDAADRAATAPVIHLADEDRNLLADFPFGSGRIVYLSDPYIVSNGGIRLSDNAQLAFNLVDAGPGLVVFDEYHHGYGRNENLLVEYFKGTPVVPIFLQIVLIVALVLYSRSRRFARPLPGGGRDRLSRLEYVAAMAQLQERTKAFDLAVENIYREFRRRVARLFGIDNHTATREQIAEKIAERTDWRRDEVADLLFRCEDIMHGEPVRKKEVVALIGRLRRIEETLGLRRGR